MKSEGVSDAVGNIHIFNSVFSICFIVFEIFGVINTTKFVFS